MSIDQFTLAMQQHLAGTNVGPSQAPKIMSEFAALGRSLDASWDPAFKIADIATHNTRSAASLLLMEKIQKQKDPAATTKYQSLFRKVAENKGNTIFEVDEYNLRTIIDYLVGKKAMSTLNGTLLPIYHTWLMNITGKYQIGTRNTSKYGPTSPKPVYYTKGIPEIEDIELVGDTPGGITGGILQSNITHQTTGKQMFAFLKDNGLSVDYSIYAKLLQIGHIESQAHLKLRISKDSLNDPAYDNGLIEQLIDLGYYLDIVSSSLRLGNPEMRMAIAKNHKPGGKIFSYVQMQIAGRALLDAQGSFTEILSNQGSGAVSGNLAIPQQLRAAVSTSIDAQGIQMSPGEKRDVVEDIKKITKALEEIQKNFKKHKAIITATFAEFSIAPPDFLINLESSDSIKTIITNEIIAVLTDKAVSTIDIKHNNVLLKKLDTSSTNILANKIKNLNIGLKQKVTAIKARAKARAKIEPKLESWGSPPPTPRLRNLGGQFTSLVSIQNIINQGLASQIQKNMGTGDRRDILNYRTGRFAESARVETMSQSRQGMITAFYSYMRNPYATFSFGGAQQQPASRDPKLLISRSIREIGATMVGNRMRAVLV